MLFPMKILTIIREGERTFAVGTSFGAAIFVTSGTAVNQHITLFFMMWPVSPLTVFREVEFTFTSFTTFGATITTASTIVFLHYLITL